MRPAFRAGNKVRSKALSWADPAEFTVGNDNDNEVIETDSLGNPASQHFPAF